jgi:hypothetical protein
MGNANRVQQFQSAMTLPLVVLIPGLLSAFFTAVPSQRTFPTAAETAQKLGMIMMDW